jgi:hypothetical protein
MELQDRAKQLKAAIQEKAKTSKRLIEIETRIAKIRGGLSQCRST